MFEFLELPQMQRAFAIALIAGPVAALLGSFITLRGMAFFSDAIAHGAMTGITLGLALKLADQINSTAMLMTLVVFCGGIGLLMAWLFERTTLHTDTVIGFTYTGSVALGVVLISKLHGYRVLEGALFGDILAASDSDVWVIAAVCAVTLLFLLVNMRALTLSVVHETLARTAGVNTRRLNYAFVVLIAVVVALLLRQVGALLVSGIIIVPAAAARVVAGSFRMMLGLSAVFGLAGAGSGVFASYHLDTPTGPTLVLAHVGILLACLAVAAFRAGPARAGVPRA